MTLRSADAAQGDVPLSPTWTMVPVTDDIVERAAAALGYSFHELRDDLAGEGIKAVPLIPNLDILIEQAVTEGGKLAMSTWHLCSTTHCRAGWAETIAGAEGKKLRVGGFAINRGGVPGALIYAAARSGKVPNFFCDDAEALASIRADAAAQRDMAGNRPFSVTGVVS